MYYNRVFNKVMPAGSYDIFVMLPDGTVAVDINPSNIVFVRPDKHAGKVATCTQDVSLLLNGVAMQETVVMNGNGTSSENGVGEELTNSL